MRRLSLSILLLAAPGWSQFTGFSKADLIKYTPLNPFERSADGRPKAPDPLLEKLRNSSSEEVWGGLLRLNYHNQFAAGWQIVHPEKTLVGRVFTAQYMPVRQELEALVQPDVKAFGRVSSSNQRVIDMLGPGDVLVVDMFGKVDNGSFTGDNLVRAIYLATGNGFVVNGGIRDLNGVQRIEAPVYCRGFSPTVFQDVMITGINVPVRLGDVTVMPGDIVFGDREGLSFIPPHLLEKVVEFGESQQLKDEWTAMKMETRKYKSRELYPSPQDPALKKEYEEWLAKRKAEGGKK